MNRCIVKVFSLSLISLMVVACTQTNPARVQDLSNNNDNQATISSASPIYNVPPNSISTSGKNNTKPNVVTTTQERIVYDRNYGEIPKGGYSGNTYTVQRGDTLYYIAWITGNDFRSLALKNNVSAPYDLSVGQVLDVSGATTVVITKQTTNNVKPPKQVQTTTTTTTTALSPIKTVSTSTSTTPTTAANTVANIKWQWPAKGNVIEKFSNATKGIDISGSLGDNVVSAADGKVVYAGNALPGYGNLIIVKHNDDYLTAYAHNQSILVREQQDVKAGQQIATMGNTGTNSVRLHFEIRYKAKSVDPLSYLPK